MGKSTGAIISDESLVQAAFLHFDQRLSWRAVAERIGHDRDTLAAAVKGERWTKAAEPYAIQHENLKTSAWIALEALVLKGDIAAVKEALNRIEGKVPDRLGGDPDNPQRIVIVKEIVGVYVDTMDYTARMLAKKFGKEVGVFMKDTFAQHIEDLRDAANKETD